MIKKKHKYSLFEKLLLPYNGVADKPPPRTGKPHKKPTPIILSSAHF